MNIPWQEIADRTNEHGYMSGIDRMSDRVKDTHEIFTPTKTVIDMLKQLLEADPTCLEPGKTVLDPAVGDGQLIVPVKWFKILVYDIQPSTALADLYGVDIMRDNVDLCRQRLINCAPGAPAYDKLWGIVSERIIMGNTLDPWANLGPEQTDVERAVMLKLYNNEATLEDFFS